jgi:hypothetical protein
MLKNAMSYTINSLIKEDAYTMKETSEIKPFPT